MRGNSETAKSLIIQCGQPKFKSLDERSYEQIHEINSPGRKNK